jgi:hypothetical protein
MVASLLAILGGIPIPVKRKRWGRRRECGTTADRQRYFFFDSFWVKMVQIFTL